MEGIILFADDHIYTSTRPENALFESIRMDLPVLGIHNLEMAEAAIQSIWTFRALILDWQFSPEDDFSDMLEEWEVGPTVPSAKEEATMAFLMKNDF